MTIRTVTMSPGFDHTVRLDGMVPGGVAHVLAWKTEAAGKGVNVAREASRLGADCVAYSLVGEVDQDEFAEMVIASGSAVVTVAVAGRTRNNLTLEVDGSGGISSHAVAPRLSATDEQADRLIAHLVAQIEPGDIVTLNGALPGGVRPEIWAEAAQEIAALNATVVADVQDAALVAVLRTGVVSMAKPNEDEARVIPGVSQAGDLALASVVWMSEQGVADPIVSVGEGGVVHIVANAISRSWCPVAEPRIAVGAGDAFVAGYCATLTDSPLSGHSSVDAGLANAALHVAGHSPSGRSAAVRKAAERVQHEILGTAP